MLKGVSATITKTFGNFYLYIMGEIEIWENVNLEFYGKFYQISNQGNVRSISRKSYTKTNVLKRTKGKELSKTKKKNGYLTVMFCLKNKKKRFYIHRLVAITFIPNPKNKPQVNHIDCNKENNNYWNLEWNTKIENTKHAILNNLIKKGENSNSSKLNNNKVLAIRRLYRINPNFNKYKLAKKLGIKDTTIHKIIRFQRWKHLI